MTIPEENDKSLMAKLASFASPRFTEKNFFILLFVIFLVLAVCIALVPYHPESDLADATTNLIWVDQYSNGTYHLSYDEWVNVWHYPRTQSVVIWHDGVYTVVNEKGPGFVCLVLPFHALGADFLFAPVMLWLAVFSTYMLGKRLWNWRAGFIAGILVLTNVTVIVMWHKYLWTDAATMHLFVLGVWLLVESIYWLNGSSLDYKNSQPATNRQKLYGIIFGILAGLAFGVSVSTRYPTALLLIPMLAFLCLFYILKAWPDLKKRDIKRTFRNSTGLWVVGLTFFLGLMCVLVPLMSYNSHFFGGAFNSGYDATPLSAFNETQGLTPRDWTETWTGSLVSRISTAFTNMLDLVPILIVRMPALLLLSLGIWLLRKNPALLLFFFIIALNFFTYLSLGWMSMYANALGTLWEPRYFMPAIPFIALFGGISIEAIVKWKYEHSAIKSKMPVERRKLSVAVIAVLLVGSLALAGIVPAADYLVSPQQPQGPGPGPNPNPNPNPGPNPNATQVLNVTTDQLLQDPLMYNQKLVHLNDTVIIDAGRPMLVRSETSSLQNGIPLIFENWTQGTVPLFPVGEKVEVLGVFRAGDQNNPQPVITIKSGTLDFVRTRP